MRGALTSLGLIVGLVFLFVSQRILSEGGVQTAFLIGGGVMILAPLVWRWLEYQRAKGASKGVEARLLAAYGGVLFALGLYALKTDAGLALLALKPETSARWSAILTVLWPAVLTVSLLTLLFMELAYRRMPVAEAVELRRIRSAAHNGLSLAFALVFLFSVNYVGSERDIKKDLSYFRTTRPSAATLKMVRGLGEPIEVVLFYPAVNEVLNQLRPYFDDLKHVSKNLKVTIRDHALATELVRKHAVRGNGMIVLLRGEGRTQRAEKIDIGTELEVARDRLRTLDGKFQEVFVKLTRQRREIYLTTGHDEHSPSGIEGDPMGARTTEITAAFMRSNITTRNLGIGQGLATEVPKDAPAVAIIGPRKPFVEEEVNALIQYVKSGGRVILMIDPDIDLGLTPLLDAIGLEMEHGTLTSMSRHFRRTSTPADRTIVFTQEFSAHPIVSVASRYSSQVAVVFYGGGALNRKESPAMINGIKAFFPIRASGDFWLDKNGNYERDADEPEQPQGFNMVASVGVPNASGGAEGRVVVIADGDFVTDQLIRFQGNGYTFGDILQWLIGEEQIVGDTSSEEDVRIEHTRDQDKLWFYLTSFGVPLPILAFGVWTAIRRRRRPREKGHEDNKEANTGMSGGHNVSARGAHS